MPAEMYTAIVCMIQSLWRVSEVIDRFDSNAKGKVPSTSQNDATSCSACRLRSVFVNGVPSALVGVKYANMDLIAVFS
jgi:hypothetical protein